MYEKKIEKALENVIIDNKNIIESGWIKKIDFSKNKIKIYLCLSNPAMHIKNKLIKEITHSIKNQNILDTICIKIEIKSDRKIKPVKNIIAIASGKGGVGKSTIATNIAVTLVQMGFHVGLLDADIYGPSIPLMFNIKEESIKLQHKNGIMNPITSYGVKILSIGFFSKYGQAIVWRGPMVTKVLRQFLHETNWGELDFLIVDLPPGTGDIHLSLLQEIPLKGIVMVSTSQKIALSDVNRSVGMFRIKSICVPILGIIENMSYVFSKKTQEKCFFFGKNGVKNFSKEMNLFFMGEIPMLQTIREYSDLGIPVVLKNEYIRNIFLEITKNMINQL
ncbi:Mrp/NBP35 family ATP-binding protein [Blattabacterium sp. DPU]|uniref:Mrp/NBP35 family ATP-binding protein n=1 Tax=Blattabacterium sp. DPU TaxID=2715232 RepID=UPI00140768C7|nr:Mrp/NBP35 family ATP-binding protein [Blattabacterium sp. DPU]QIK16734.1 Mrp/NBP35 family ATP-binding protein [Blattabacterium sp. DPU]